MTGRYQAARDEVVLLSQRPRRVLQVAGRAPSQMLSGLITGPIPPDLKIPRLGLGAGRFPYSAILTPKGRLVTDLRVGRLGDGEEGTLLLDLPAAGADDAMAHLAKYLPPRLASVSEPPEPASVSTLIGPAGPDALASVVGDEGIDTGELLRLEAGEERILTDGSPLGIRLIRNDDVSPLALDVLAAEGTVRELEGELESAGVPRGDEALWRVLRLERGRPAFGEELDSDTMPEEAGLHDRAIDHSKGCYTGQEVVVRIRDRGHVNRHLRGLLLGGQPVQEEGTPLFTSEDKPAGTIRSSAHSPLWGQTIGMGYLRRQVQPPTTVAIGKAGGLQVQVRALNDDGWILVEGDARF